jgi:hypothetical protein
MLGFSVPRSHAHRPHDSASQRPLDFLPISHTPKLLTGLPFSLARAVKRTVKTYRHSTEG